MDDAEACKSTSSEETSQLHRNRSFKSKQLVRSQAIRESQSPPRAISPLQYNTSNITYNPTSNAASDTETRVVSAAANASDNCSHFSGRSSDVISSSDVKVSDSDDYKKQQVEIQITPGWESNPESEQRMRSRRWLSHTHSESSRDLLSNNPRVACVCGVCAACPTCRGRRKRQLCHTKQDSGFVCSDECPDCSDTDQSGVSNNEVMRKSGSLDAEDQAYYCRCPERKEKPKNVSLNKNDSEERQEPTGPELVNFIKETLNKNPRDRMALLKIEKELHSLVADTGRCIVRFPVMTSYGRMLVHRCAALFQLSHHLDQTNKTSVLVSKSGTSGGRLPCTSFKEWCVANFPPSPQRQHQPTAAHTKSILKRDAHSLDEPGAGALSSSRSKSLEQRERDYERVRRRIFSSDNCAQPDESQWPWVNTGPVKVLTPETGGRNKLLKVQSLETSGPESAATNWRARGCVSKSHSFGGYTTDHHPHRLLSRQGDLASSSWRLSPSSSGYKTLSLRSTDSITPSPTGGASPEPGASERVVWCVSDVSAVPAGAVVIHPQTGRPLTNPDGSVYHFDPANPPLLYDTANEQQKVDKINEKRRGRLKKQHSFIDNDSECQPEECRNKCCCECRRQDACARNVTDKETNTKSASPQNRYESKPTSHTKEKSNRKSPYESTTNQKLSFEQTANQQAPEARHAETTNQRQVYETQTATQKLERSIEMANQRPANEVPVNRSAKLSRQESREVQQYPQAYVQAYRQEELCYQVSPQVGQYAPPEMPMQPALQAKVTPVPIPDPNIRPVSLTNMMYSTAVAQAYPYQCRVDHTLQPVYQQLVPAPEEAKQITATAHATEATFRIDPSYPYAAVDYSAATCGACVDTAALQQRSYSVPYGQVEVPQVLPTYPVSNVLLPQSHLQPYPYQDPLGWPGVAAAPKIMLPEIYPIVSYPQAAYPHYNIMYPQVLPQAYPMCQPMYPVAETKPPEPRRESVPTRYKRGSGPGSSRTTPSQVHHDHLREEKVPYEDKNEIAAKIQQIKHQMAQLNTHDKDSNREDWRRSTGNGLLGNYTANAAYNGSPAVPTGRISSDDSQLSSAARAIVNSIRNMQAKSTYQESRRSERHDGRSDRRRAREDAERPRPDSDRPRHDADVSRQDATKAPTVAYDPTRSQLRQPLLLRQMTPGTWYRRSPGPVHQVLNTRRANSDARNPRR